MLRLPPFVPSSPPLEEEPKKARVDSAPPPAADLSPRPAITALTRLCPSIDTVALHLVVSGIPLSMSAEELFDNVSDILDFHGLPLDEVHLKVTLGITPPTPWSGATHLSNIRRLPSGGGQLTDDPTGSLVLSLLRPCTFGRVWDPPSDQFLRVLSEQGALTEMDDKRRFHPLLHFNPEAETNIPAVLDPDSLLFVIRGGTGVDATDSFLCTRAAILQDILNCGPVSVHAESCRRGLRAATLDRRGKFTTTARYATEILLMVRLIDQSPDRNLIRERIYDQIRRWCADNSNTNWSAEEATGVLSQCPVLWLLPDDLVFELYAPFYTQYMDKFRTTYSYPHFTRGAERAVSLVTLLPPLPEGPPSLADFITYLSVHRYDVDSISCIYPLPPIRHHQASTTQGRSYSADCAFHRIVIVWAQGVSRSLPSQLLLPGRIFPIHTSVIAEEADNLPGFWTAGEQTTKKLYFNGFMRQLHLQYIKFTGAGLRPGLAPTLRFRQYSPLSSAFGPPLDQAPPPSSAWKETPRVPASRSPSYNNSPSDSMAPSRTPRSPSSPSPGAVVSTRAVHSPPSPMSTTVVPARSSALAPPQQSYDLTALVASLANISGQLTEQTRQFTEHTRMFNDMQQVQRQQQAQLDELSRRLPDASHR